MSRSALEDRFRALPSVDTLLHHAEFALWLERCPREFVGRVVREALSAAREEIAHRGTSPTELDIRRDAVAHLEALFVPFSQVINGTGVVLHTNLGRAPLSDLALAAMQTIAGYGNVEYDLGRGARGSRQATVAALLRVLTGAEAALVAVNNAAAVLLALTAVARGTEVLVSRGQSVEIGGNFRIPEILLQSGATLVDVGTTNRTRLADYEVAITARTGAILHVHASNFQIVGFAAEPSISELATLCNERGIALLVDNGSGALLDTATFGLAHEPMPQEMLQAGASLVAFSGDKLLGGPQCGIVLGSAALINRLASHPLARALRPDKVTLAALAATLQAYMRGDATRTLPVWQIIAQTGDQVHERARSWQRAAAREGIDVRLESGESTVGGGSIPGSILPTTMLILPSSVRAEDLRGADPPIVPRTQQGRVQIDIRTVLPAQESALLDAVLGVLARKNGVLDSDT